MTDEITALRARLEAVEAERDAVVAARDMLGGWWEHEKNLRLEMIAHVERAETALATAQHALVVWDAAHRTGRNDPLVHAFEVGAEALTAIRALAARLAEVEAQLKATLDREAATYARHDARAERAEALLAQAVEAGRIALDQDAGETDRRLAMKDLRTILALIDQPQAATTDRTYEDGVRDAERAASPFQIEDGAAELKGEKDE